MSCGIFIIGKEAERRENLTCNLHNKYIERIISDYLRLHLEFCNKIDSQCKQNSIRMLIEGKQLK